MVIKSYFIPILLILTASLANAQQDSLNPVCKLLKLNSNWDFGAGARFSFLDFDEMNRALESAGLPGLESPVMCLDMGVRTSCSWKYLVMETGLKYSFGSSSERNMNNRQSVTFRDYALQSRLLFDVFEGNEFSKIFPYAGLGISYQTLRTYDDNPVVNDDGTSSQVAANTLNRRFTYIPFSFETGLSMEQGFRAWGKKVIVGMRCGYAFRFFQTTWSLHDYQVELPKPAPSSPFIALILRVKSDPYRKCLPREAR